MTAVVCLLAVLTAPPTSSDTAEEVKTVVTEETEQPPLKPYEIRRALHTALKDEATSETLADRYDATERLCALFYEMMLNQDFPDYDRQKWRARLVSRLRSVRDDLQKLPPKEETDRSRANTVDARGGGAIDERGADQLIDLITTTIDPETWDIHGGNGSIFYYSNLRVLVIRQTQEVHEKIGGIQHGL